jgi:hypothetical protein
MLVNGEKLSFCMFLIKELCTFKRCFYIRDVDQKLFIQDLHGNHVYHVYIVYRNEKYCNHITSLTGLVASSGNKTVISECNKNL